MEINIYQTYEEWMAEKPSYEVEGEVEQHRSGLVLLKTLENKHRYREILSSHKVFAITYKLSSGFLMYHDEINIFLDALSWKNSEPVVSFEGQICLEECTNEQICFISLDGYKQIIFLANLFAITYERK